MRTDKLEMDQRNRFLAALTDEVAALCLRNNYLQPLAMSLAERARRRRPARPPRADRERWSTRPAQPRRRVPARRRDAQCPRRERQGPDPARARGDPRLRQELALRRSARRQGAGRPLSGARAVPLFPAAARRPLSRCGDLAPAAPRSDRDGPHQPDDQSRRAGLRGQDDGRDQRRCRPGRRRLLPRPRRLWARAALCRDRCARWPDRRQAPSSTSTPISQMLLERETLWLLRNADFTQPLGDLVLRYAEGVTDVAGLVVEPRAARPRTGDRCARAMPSWPAARPAPSRAASPSSAR